MKTIFVFGSNLAGRHGKGAALHARECHGAIYGFGVGRQGDSYAIPTKGYHMKPLALVDIGKHAAKFIAYAASNPTLTFNVTRIGCGLAGYKDEDIAPMFKGSPPNCKFDPAWEDYLK